MDVLALKRQGWTIKDIAAAVERHPATVSGWLERGGPPDGRDSSSLDLVMDEYWAGKVNEILTVNSNLLGTSVMRLLKAQDFKGSYPTVVRHLREVRGVRKSKISAVSVPIVTGPGEEFQFDWTDCNRWARMWGLGELHCFGAILCYSRYRFWWFAPSVDRSHTFEGLVRFFEDVGGVAGIGRTDRMGCLGQSRGRRFEFFPESLAFALFHGCALKACATGDAKRKGKIERPFRELKEAFLEELLVLGPPASIAELNQRAQLWLQKEIHPRPHRVTGVPPAERLEHERGLLAPLPRMRYDTALVEPRRVGAAVPLIEVGGVSYSVPPNLVGTMVEIRVPVDSGVLEVKALGSLVATHQVAPPGSEPVWDPLHRKEAEALALAPHARRTEQLSVVKEEQPSFFDFHDGDYEVALPDLDVYQEVGCGCGSGGAA